MRPRRPSQVDWSYTGQLRDMYKLFPALVKGVPENVVCYVVNQRCGKAYYAKRVITLPIWVFTNPRGEGFALYYLAHELAHIANFDAGTWNSRKPHGPAFMEEFKKLCPVKYQHFETGYKPRNAAAAGISRKRVTL